MGRAIRPAHRGNPNMGIHFDRFALAADHLIAMGWNYSFKQDLWIAADPRVVGRIMLVDPRWDGVVMVQVWERGR
jgi:hypothetical protein